MSKEARKIHIIGGSGSGKTTLARRLAVRLNLPAYDLDEIGYEGGSGPKRSLELRLAEIDQILSGPGWITEGIYLGWIEKLLQEADVIIWLDLPWRIVAWRIVFRHFKASLTRTNRHPGIRKLINFLNWNRKFYVVSNPATQSAPDDDNGLARSLIIRELEAYNSKLIHCRHPREVAALLKSL